MKTKHFTIIALALAVFSFSASICSGQHKASLMKRINNVENGLVKFDWSPGFTLEQLLDKERNDTSPKLNIYDRMKNYNVPGVSMAVIDDFKISWAKGYGVTEAGTGNNVTTETMFQSGSTTKVLMAIVVLRMAEQGKLDLDTDINVYLRSWKMPEHPSGTKVTLRMLMTHQSGINRPGDGFYSEPGSQPSLVQFLKGERPVLNDSVFFENAPGTAHSYSNFGYIIMQFLLEDYFNVSYTQLVKQYVFEPLDLKSSFIEYPFPAEYADRVIRPHDKDGIPNPYDGLYSSALAQAGMITTPTDWATIACELMNAYKGKSNKILSQKSVQAMFNTELKLNPAEFEGISGQGLGMFLIGEGTDQYFLHPGQNSPGANCMFIGSVSEGKGVIIMTNGMQGILLALEILSSVAYEYNW